MIAVIEDRNKQYRVQAGDQLLIDYNESLEADAEVTFDKVLYVGGEGSPKLGAPYVDGASVKAKVIGHELGDKIKVFVFKRRKDYSRRLGHRQRMTRLEITSVG